MVMALLFLPIWGDGQANLLVDDMAKFGILVNIFLAVFNMVPIPPLDGGRVLAGLMPPSVARILDSIEPFGILIVVGLIALDIYTELELLVPYILVPVVELRDVFYALADHLVATGGAI